MESDLYYIDPSETRESSFKSPPIILSGSNNYSTWHRAMARAFNLNKKLRFVDGTVEVPPKDHHNYGAWKQCNDLVLSWIVKSISPEIASSVRDMENAVDVWRNLKKLFSPGLQSMILDILEEIRSLKQGHRDVGSYFKEFCVLWSDLELLRPVPDCNCATKCCCGAMEKLKEQIENEKVGRFLKGLNEHRFEGIRSRIMREDPLPPLSQVCISVFQEESQIVSAPRLSLSLSQSQLPSASTQAIANTQPEQEATKSNQILVHSIHPYPLTLKPAIESYTCSGCKELIFGPSYSCESSDCTECNQINGSIFTLDEVCAHAVIEHYNNNNSSPVHHPYFKKSNFYFREKPPGYPRICDACTQNVKGFVYHCSHTSIDLHPRCLKLKTSVCNKEVGVTLELREKIDTKKIKCQKCRKNNEYDKRGKGWLYVSSNGDHCFHVSCFKEFIYDNRELFKKKRSKEIRGRSCSSSSNNELEEVITGGSRKKQKKEMIKVGVSSSSGAMKKVGRIASAVFKLLFSVIFGDPVSFVFGLLEVVMVGFG